ncbi:MAG: hypothetical protein ACC656_02550, partial [Candidatus Heimdallarchaeota archaeon]
RLTNGSRILLIESTDNIMANNPKITEIEEEEEEEEDVNPDMSNVDFDFDPAKTEKYIRFGWDVDEEPILVNDFVPATSEILELSELLTLNKNENDILKYYIVGFLTIEPGVDLLVLLVTDDEGSTWRPEDIYDVESIIDELKKESDKQQLTGFENRFFKVIVQTVPTDIGFEEIITNLDEWA